MQQESFKVQHRTHFTHLEELEEQASHFGQKWKPIKAFYTQILHPKHKNRSHRPDLVLLCHQEDSLPIYYTSLQQTFLGRSRIWAFSSRYWIWILKDCKKQNLQVYFQGSKIKTVLKLGTNSTDLFSLCLF